MSSADEVVFVLRLALALGPLAIYFLGLGLVNSSARPCVVRARADFVVLAIAVVPMVATIPAGREPAALVAARGDDPKLAVGLAHAHLDRGQRPRQARGDAGVDRPSHHPLDGAGARPQGHEKRWLPGILEERAVSDRGRYFCRPRSRSAATGSPRSTSTTTPSAGSSPHTRFVSRTRCSIESSPAPTPPS